MARKVVRNVNGVHGREPLHNDASHGSDAFQCLAVCAKQPQAPPPPAPPRLDGVNLLASFRGRRNGSHLLSFPDRTCPAWATFRKAGFTAPPLRTRAPHPCSSTLRDCPGGIPDAAAPLPHGRQSWRNPAV